MVEWHTKSKKKISGGKRKTVLRCTKKNAWRGGEAANTKTSTNEKEVRQIKDGRGLQKKCRLISTKTANIFEGNKIIKAEVVDVEENTSNRLFARSNTATKGAIINVKIGKEEKKAKITNRPGQEGIINAKLI
jgi:small subunit ribosomal protein S8e